MNRIAELRKEHGLTQVQLADMLRIAQNTLSQYENERRTPDIKTVMDIAKYFHVPVNYVLGLPESIELSSPPASDITQVTKIFRTYEMDQVNFYLAIGWRLLHVGQWSTSSYGETSADTVYTLGWFGNPDAPGAQIDAKIDIWRDAE